MVAEPTGPTLGVSPSWGPWAQGGDPWSQSNNGTGNSTSGTNGDQPFSHFDNIISWLMALVCLCGVMGNWAIVWLLWFRQRRSRFSLFILVLALFDGLFLLYNGILYICLLLHLKVWGNPWVVFQLTRLGLLVAGSIELCVSGLCPLRHRWPCLDYSSVVFLLICVLAMCLWVSDSVCEKVGAPCDGLDWVYVVTMVVTLPVLCVSSLTLLMRVQCSSRGTRHKRLHVTVLLSVLSFLLLGLPYTVHNLVLTIAPDTVYVPGLWETLGLLSALNSMVNPIIYFFMRRYRQQPGRTPLREVHQRVLTDDKEGLSGRTPSSPQTPLRLPSSGERAARSELDRAPSRAAAQEAGSPSVSPQGPCEEEAVPVLRH